MIGYIINNQGIFTSRGDCIIESPYLDFLAEAYPGELKILYDLDASVSSLAHLTLNRDEADKLYQNERLRILPYKLTYFPRRFFSVDKGAGTGHPYSNFANARRYKSEVHYLPTDTSQDYIAKAREAQTIGEEASQILKSLGVNKDRITSPVGAVIDEYVKPLRLLTVDDIPEEAGELAYNCIKGNWMEAWQLGYWQDAYDYDINGAYGSELAELLDLRRGEWIKGTVPPDNATYGFCEGYITTRADYHPFLVRETEDFATTPVGTWLDFFTLTELKLIKAYNLGNVEIKRGWWWVSTGIPYTPLKGLVSILWNRRVNSQGLEKDIIRQVLAGIWGRFSQIVKGEMGESFNPVYASVVESNTRCKVARTCLEAGIAPLHVAVDGIITDKPLDISDSREIGGWRLSHRGQCIIASAGVVGFEGKQGVEEFSLLFEWLYNQLKDNPEESEYTMTKWSPVTLGKALETDYDRLGELEKLTRSIYIGIDYKRLWYKSPLCGRDLLVNKYESVPLDAHLVGALKESFDKSSRSS